jgi:hypothetical protein
MARNQRKTRWLEADTGRINGSTIAWCRSSARGNA